MSLLNIRQLVKEFLTINGHDLDNISEELLSTIQVLVETTFQKSILDTRMLITGLSDNNGNVNVEEAKECIRGLLVDYGILQGSDPQFEQFKRMAQGFVEDSLGKECLYQEMPDEDEHDWENGDPETLETIVDLVFSAEDTSVEEMYSENVLLFLEEQYPDYA